MAFFERHPSIESLDIRPTSSTDRWFAPELPQNFLPQLLHLGAYWNDVRALAPILHQLLGLAIYRSFNGQIPYLLRYILPNGLPNLERLVIDQHRALEQDSTMEGVFWCESEDGTFGENPNVFVAYYFMHSIVRATPNLKELGFLGTCLCYDSDYLSLAYDLSCLLHLKHLYYRGQLYHFHSPLKADQVNAFAALAGALAAAVPQLESITCTVRMFPPYLTARIRRTRSGEVAGLAVGKGYGMKIGYDDEAFPWAPKSMGGLSRLDS